MASISSKSHDAQFVALARELGAKFCTRDKELLKKLPEMTEAW